MKIKLLLLLFILTVSCSGPKGINGETKEINLHALQKYKAELIKSKKHSIVIADKKKVGYKAYFYKNQKQGYNFDEYDNQKNKIRETVLNSDNSIDVIENIDDYFTSYQIYYPNGNIKSKRVSSWLGFTSGASYQYDENGNTTETKDWDEGYAFTFKDVLQFLDALPYKIQKTSPITINKIIHNDIKIWVITYHDRNSNKQLTYVLDASNGKILNQYEENLPVVPNGN